MGDKKSFHHLTTNQNNYFRIFFLHFVSEGSIETTTEIAVISNGSLRFQIASGFDLKSLAIWASKIADRETVLGVVSAQLPGEIFRAILVMFGQF